VAVICGIDYLARMLLILGWAAEMRVQVFSRLQQLLLLPINLPYKTQHQTIKVAKVLVSFL
jgi:hypothetical protein